MGALEILLLSVALGADAFSVAIGVGACWHGRRQIFRLSFHFGLFQFFMPLVGWLLGEWATGLVGPIGRFVAAAVLAAIAVRMLIHYARGKEKPIDERCDPTRSWSLVGLSLATSIDALGAGFGLGLIATNLLFVCVIIGATAMLMTVAGMVLSGKLSDLFGRRVEAIGGIVLMILAVKMALVG